MRKACLTLISLLASVSLTQWTSANASQPGCVRAGLPTNGKTANGNQDKNARVQAIEQQIKKLESIRQDLERQLEMADKQSDSDEYRTYPSLRVTSLQRQIIEIQHQIDTLRLKAARGGEEPANGAIPNSASQQTPLTGPQGLSLDKVQINWGPVADQFVLSNPRVENTTMQEALGHQRPITAITLTVEAKGNWFAPVFSVLFIDADGAECAKRSMVCFDPPAIEWRAGERRRAFVPLEGDMSRVRAIRCQSLMPLMP